MSLGRGQWYAYDRDNGFEQFDTEEEARAFAEESLAAYRRESVADKEWHEDVEGIHWGRLIPSQRVRVVASGPASEDDGETGEWQDYGLVDEGAAPTSADDLRSMAAGVIATLQSDTRAAEQRTREECAVMVDAANVSDMGALPSELRALAERMRKGGG